MDAPDAIPSDDARVVIPALLRGILRETAEDNLRKACDLAFPPDRRDDVVEAVHVIDAFEGDCLTIDHVTKLLSDAIAWAEGERVEPSTAEAVRIDERLLKIIRELVEFRDSLGGPEDAPASGGGER
jgi:hypothetical protein